MEVRSSIRLKSTVIRKSMGTQSIRLERAKELGQKKGMTHIEIALAYVLSQSFPVTALVGAANKTEILSCVKAADTVLTADEIAFLELRE